MTSSLPSSEPAVRTRRLTQAYASAAAAVANLFGAIEHQHGNAFPELRGIAEHARDTLHLAQEIILDVRRGSLAERAAEASKLVNGMANLAYEQLAALQVTAHVEHSAEVAIFEMQQLLRALQRLASVFRSHAQSVLLAAEDVLELALLMTTPSSEVAEIARERNTCIAQLGMAYGIKEDDVARQIFLSEMPCVMRSIGSIEEG